MLASAVGESVSLRTFTRVIALLVGLLALAGFESWLRPRQLERGLPTGTAKWIWASKIGPEDGWVNFFLHKDFALNNEPAHAELKIQADEGYWTFLNGKAIGSGAFREEAPLDSYDVGRFLRLGRNRIVVQVRSRRGTGGLLASLDVNDEESIVSDSTWEATWRYERALFRPGFRPEDAAGVHVWGRPPIGRWDVPRAVVRIPDVERQLVNPKPREALRTRSFGGSGWDRRFPKAEQRVPLGRWVVFDLGEVVTGYSNVVFASRGGTFGIVFAGIDRPYEPGMSEPVARFQAPPGQGSWSDPEPRRFRFLTVLANAEIAGLRVFETAAEMVTSRAADVTVRSTAFGIEPPSGPSVEDEFWRKLERLTGFTGREAFESFPGG